MPEGAPARGQRVVIDPDGEVVHAVGDLGWVAGTWYFALACDHPDAPMARWTLSNVRRSQKRVTCLECLAEDHDAR